MIKREDIEILAPAGSPQSLQAAINAGCDAVYFGVKELNMRSSSHKFDLDDLNTITKQCHSAGVKCYLALNVLVYDNELEKMHKVIDAVKKSEVDAVISFDFSVIKYARSIGVEVHISTQHSISNIGAVEFFSQWADRLVLARELTLEQIKFITNEIKNRKICGPKGELVQIEAFVHGAMCVSVSGRCGMSLYMHNSSANRGQCSQPCRRSYTVTDKATGKALEIDNEYVMSPEDLCTIGALDEIIASGVVSLKIEGRGRSPEYVDKAVSIYKEAVDSIFEKDYTDKKIEKWNEGLDTVFHRGLSDGFYRGKAFKYWAGVAGSRAKEKKELLGIVNRYYPKIKVAEITMQSGELSDNEEVIFIGVKTGVVRQKVVDMHVAGKQKSNSVKSDEVTFAVDKKVRAGDKVYKVVLNDPMKARKATQQ